MESTLHIKSLDPLLPSKMTERAERIGVEGAFFAFGLARVAMDNMLRGVLKRGTQ